MGWVIFSYPVECIYDLGEAMASTNIMPNRTVVFQISENSIVERLANRMVDSLTGREYHALYNPATAENIRNRLSKREKTRKQFQQPTRRYFGRFERYRSANDQR